MIDYHGKRFCQGCEVYAREDAGMVEVPIKGDSDSDSDSGLCEVVFSGGEKLGIKLGITSQDFGRVIQVEPGTACARAGVRVGCTVASINSEAISVELAAERLQAQIATGDSFCVSFRDADGGAGPDETTRPADRRGSVAQFLEPAPGPVNEPI